MKYYDVHVQRSQKDGDGYSIPVAIENGGEEEAIEKAKKENRFEYEEDVDDVDYIDEIDEEYYEDMTR